jgi:hypothetical protein
VKNRVRIPIFFGPRFRKPTLFRKIITDSFTFLLGVHVVFV